MRRELIKLGDDTEMATAQIDNSLEELGELREEVAEQVRTARKTLVTVNTDVRQVQETTATVKTDVAKIMSVLTKLGKQIKTNEEASAALAAHVTDTVQSHKWIEDEYLMEQLTAMQERYESELQKCKTEYRRIFNEKQLAIDGLSQALTKVQADYMEALRQNNLVAGVREQQLKDLAHQVGEMGRSVQSCSRESFELRNEAAAMGHHLRDLDGRVADIAMRPLQSAPMAAAPVPLIDTSSQNAMHEEIHRMGQDVRLMGSDLTRLARRTDESHNELRQWFTTELKRMASEVFAALQHDSHQHIAENKRMRDTIFDLQADIRELRQERIRVEEELRQDANRNRRSPSPPGYAKRRRRYEPADAGPPPFVRFSDAPPPARPLMNHPPLPPFPGHEQMERPGFNPFFPRGDLQRRSRSRSRSPRPRPPPHRVQMDADTSRAELPRWREDRSAASSSAPPRVPNAAPTRVPIAAPALPAAPERENPQSAPPLSSTESASAQPSDSATGANRDIRTRLRPRKSRAHDVIVIEEDEESGEDNAGAANAAPTCVPADDESPPAAMESEPPAIIDRLDSIEDIRVGAELYFHFGGAPNLTFEWTSRFDKLKTDDCVDMARTVKFQQQYQSLQFFPIHFTQFVIQSVVVNGAARAKSGTSQNLDKLDVKIVAAEYQTAANRIRRSWVEALVEHLKAFAAQSMSAADASALQLSMHPCLAVNGMIAAVQDETIVDDWRQKQANALFALTKSRLDTSRRFFQDWQDEYARGSPAAYLLVLMFDVERVHMENHQSADFRMTDFGRALVLKLWTHSLAQLPYLLFVDCSWLEDQSETRGRISSLAFCHVLATILVWNSLTDIKRIVTPRYYDMVLKSLLKMLYVEGRCQDAEIMSVDLKNKKSLIELRGVDSNFVSVTDLDDFYEIARASQANT